MNYEYINLDRYNNQANCRFNDTGYVFKSFEDFTKNLNFPYSVNMLSWEPLRDHYVVERNINEFLNGSSLVEFLWISENLDSIKKYCVAMNNLELNNNDSIINERDLRLHKTDWILQRYQEENILNIQNSISLDKLNDILQYRQALRDISKTYPNPFDIVWPINPME